MTAPTPVRVPVDVGELEVLDLRPSERERGTVALLHGFPQGATCWRYVWPRLVDAGYRVLVPDQRGYSPGARPAEVEQYGPAALEQDVLRMLDACGVDRAHVVGHDWGANIAWRVAGLHPQRVRTLTTVSVGHPSAYMEALGQSDQAIRSTYIGEFLVEGVAEASLLDGDARGLHSFLQPLPDAHTYVDRMSRPGALTAALNWYRASHHVPAPPVPRIDVPTLLVWSDADAFCGPDQAELTGSYIDGPYRYEVLRGVSHWVPEQAAGPLTDLMLEHLGPHGDA